MHASASETKEARSVDGIAKSGVVPTNASDKNARGYTGFNAAWFCEWESVVGGALHAIQVRALPFF